jgi:hypothetical protein
LFFHLWNAIQFSLHVQGRIVGPGDDVNSPWMNLVLPAGNEAKVAKPAGTWVNRYFAATATS